MKIAGFKKIEDEIDKNKVVVAITYVISRTVYNYSYVSSSISLTHV